MIVAAIAPWPLGLVGPIYGWVSITLNAAFLLLSFRVLVNTAQEPSGMKPEKQLFGFSILYLFALFSALVIDRMLIS